MAEEQKNRFFDENETPFEVIPKEEIETIEENKDEETLRNSE